MVPYSLLVIKPLTVSRGDAPQILQEILHKHPLVLRKFRVWPICDTTLRALTYSKSSKWDYERERIFCARHMLSWICVFTHLDRVTDPQEILEQVCGPSDWSLQTSAHLRHRYSSKRDDLDPVFHLADKERQNLEATLLFMTFEEKAL